MILLRHRVFLTRRDHMTGTAYGIVPVKPNATPLISVTLWEEIYQRWLVSCD
jgi:hypothetical protein